MAKPYKKPMFGEARWALFPGMMLVMGVVFAQFSVLWVLLGTALVFLLGMAIVRTPRTEV
ncbi:MAG: hypothetical protein ACOCX1_02570 [Fimbriimonadaceae bacterium]